MLLPATLKSIKIRFKATSAAAINCVLAAFSNHRWLASLKLPLWAGRMPEQMSFAPLQSLPTLKTLSLEVCGSESNDPTLSPKQVQELRALKQLTELGCNFCEQTLLELVQTPHQLRWTARPYSGRRHITGEVAALLPSLLQLLSLNINVSGTLYSVRRRTSPCRVSTHR